MLEEGGNGGAGRVVFVAHKYDDAALIQELAISIFQAGLGWRFEEIVPLTPDWRLLARDRIRSAQAFAILGTNHSVSSPNCRFEWEYAMQQSKPILVLLLDQQEAVELPPELEAYPRVSISEEHLSDAAIAVARALDVATLR